MESDEFGGGGDGMGWDGMGWMDGMGWDGWRAEGPTARGTDPRNRSRSPRGSNLSCREAKAYLTEAGSPPPPLNTGTSSSVDLSVTRIS